MHSNINLVSNMFSTLGFIKQYTSSLSERYLDQQYNNTDYGPVLQHLIVSAFRDLSQCIDIINKRAPISKLTQDPLSVIFQHAHQDDLAMSDPQGTWFPPSIPVPLCLSQVSKSWKSVATNLPTLWTTVKVTTPWSLASIETCLSMSKTLPIDLYIKGLKWKHREPFMDLILDDYEDDMEGLCSTLSPHIRRCRSIFITTDQTFWPLLLEVKNQFSDLEAPLLETLSVIGGSSSVSHGRDPDELFRYSAPRLSDVRFSVDALDVFHPPFGSITSLSLLHGLDYLGSRALVCILSECAVLETLIIYEDCLTIWPSLRGHQFSMPKLRSIQLHGYTPRTIEFLLQLSTPSLVELFAVPYSPRDWLLLNTNMQQPPPFSTLKTLTISPDVNIWSPTEIDVAFNNASSFFPYLGSLTLLSKEPHLMLSSIAKVQDGKAWPNLQTLTLGVSTRCDLPSLSGWELTTTDESWEDALLEFITLRKAARMGLPQIVLDRESLLKMTRLDWLRTQIDIIEHEGVPAHVRDPMFPEIEDNSLEDD